MTAGQGPPDNHMDAAVGLTCVGLGGRRLSSTSEGATWSFSGPTRAVSLMLTCFRFILTTVPRTDLLPGSSRTKSSSRLS